MSVKTVNKTAQRTRSRSKGRAATVSLVLGAVTALTAAVGAVVTLKVALTVITPVRKRPHLDVVLGADHSAGTITLKATTESLMPGRVGLWFGHDDSYAVVGPILRREKNKVVRTLESVDGPSALRGRARITGNYYTQPEDLQIPYRAVSIPTDLGPAPAWEFPSATGQNGLWAIAVHGWRSSREEPLRAVPLFHSMGYTSLLLSYRNDSDAPASADHRYGLGGTEWEDVEAAISYAREHGAQKVVLMGWSMGGAIVLQTALRTRHPDLIAGLILESPVIDWVTTLRYQAQLMHLPKPLTSLALKLLQSPRASSLVGLSKGIDFGELDLVHRARELSVPILLLHSDSDGFVPPGPSQTLARVRGDLVTFVPFTDALHTRLWNNDEHTWSEAITTWLDHLALARS